MKITSLFIISFLVITSFLIVGCATNGDNLSSNNKPKKESIYLSYINEKKLEPQKKITSFRFHGWRSLDNEFLILNTSFSKPYLIDLIGYCADLRFTNTIAVHNDGSTLQAKFDSISVPDQYATKCRIDSIYKITREQAKEITSLKASKEKEAEKG